MLWKCHHADYYTFMNKIYVPAWHPHFSCTFAPCGLLSELQKLWPNWFITMAAISMLLQVEKHHGMTTNTLAIIRYLIGGYFLVQRQSKNLIICSSSSSPSQGGIKSEYKGQRTVDCTGKVAPPPYLGIIEHRKLYQWKMRPYGWQKEVNCSMQINCEADSIKSQADFTSAPMAWALPLNWE